MQKILILLFTFSSFHLLAQKIDRKALVTRHNVVVTKADTLSSLTVGNGGFAFTVDVTGLQSFPKEYSKGISLGTQSEWGWHSFIDTVGYKREEALKTYQVNGRGITYLTQQNDPPRKKEAANWFRQNPHRLQLGNVGFEFVKRDGSIATLNDVQNIRQELNLWTGEIKSHFTIEGVPVYVSTVCRDTFDAIGVKVESTLIKEKRLRLKLTFPYPTGAWTDEGANWPVNANHTSSIVKQDKTRAVINHILDSSYYLVSVGYDQANIRQTAKHIFLLEPKTTQSSFEATVSFSPPTELPFSFRYQQIKKSSENAWMNYWQSGGAIDFSGSTDKRAFELERRIILSQYLMKTQEAGNYPPQETGLTYNSWFGKPHLEMTWWHAAHWGLWGKVEYIEKLLGWYASVAPKGKDIAQRQGFDGVRWQKMTDNSGDETPS
ncbi:MAG TPA: hypothetical protein VGB71_10775, partial [Flavisolibacter sp.]